MIPYSAIDIQGIQSSKDVVLYFLRSYLNVIQLGLFLWLVVPSWLPWPVSSAIVLPAIEIPGGTCAASAAVCSQCCRFLASSTSFFRLPNDKLYFIMFNKNCVISISWTDNALCTQSIFICWWNSTLCRIYICLRLKSRIRCDANIW